LVSLLQKPYGQNARSSVVYVIKTPSTQWENKEKMVQHIMVGYAVKTPSNPVGK
jgi:hypothetical protein